MGRYLFFVGQSQGGVMSVGDSQQPDGAPTPPQQLEQSVGDGDATSWFTEVLYRGVAVKIAVDEVLSAPFTSRFAGGEQQLFLFRNRDLGYVLVIDGVVQFVTADTAYPELMAHVAMFAHQHHPRCPKTVLVVGGGDMEIARELLRHAQDGGPIKRIIVVDIDPRVTDLIRSHIPAMGCITVGKGAERRVVSVFEHPAVEIVHEDARTYVKRMKRDSVDVVICDTTDEKNVAVPLFGIDFLEDVHAVLAKGGILARLAGSLLLQKDEVKKSLAQSREVFKHSGSTALLTIPSLRYYGGNFGAVISSKGDRVHLSPTAYHKYARGWLKELRHYSIERHKWLLTPEPWVLKEFFGK